MSATRAKRDLVVGVRIRASRFVAVGWHSLALIGVRVSCNGRVRSASKGHPLLALRTRDAGAEEISAISVPYDDTRGIATSPLHTRRPRPCAARSCRHLQLSWSWAPSPAAFGGTGAPRPM